MVDARILCADRPTCLLRARRDRLRAATVSLLSAAVCCLAFAANQSAAFAVTPESPEVRDLIDRGLKSLDGHSETRLGGLCLIGLAFTKDGASPDNPHVQTAVEACLATSAQQARMIDVYSNGLAIIFLAELNPSKYREKLGDFTRAMLDRQKTHGGWGYESYKTGDTSQTQYAALSFWEMLQVGMPPDVEQADACANWLLRTQDPSGAWGYQGTDPGSFELVEQRGVGSSMLFAGMGSTMIFGNILGLTSTTSNAVEAPVAAKVSSALKRADSEGKKVMRSISGTQVDRNRMLSAISRGQSWFAKNFSPGAIQEAEYPAYLLYSLERYKSFEEVLDGALVDEPLWYQQGYEYLAGKELDGGGWRGKSGQPCSTAFAVLFLLRSTQKSIKANMGQGTLVGGRGLSANLSRMRMRNGRLVTEEKPTEIDKFLGMLDGEGSEQLDALVNDPTALQVNNVGPEESRRLQQIVRSGDPTARILAVRALSKMRDLDYVPSLIFAMTDPDKRVVREARDGLRFVSRRFQGFGLEDNFDDSARYRAIELWKGWYRLVRPSAPPLP